jgi:hypothetical protein
MSLHHFWIVHGSSINRSEEPRIDIATRYVALAERPTDEALRAGEGLNAEILQRVPARASGNRFGQILSATKVSSGVLLDLTLPEIACCMLY